MTDLTSVNVTVASDSCTFTGSPDPIEEYATSNSGLQNLGGGNYQYDWKTPKNYAGTCKTLRVDVGDGIQHTAFFQFVK